MANSLFSQQIPLMRPWLGPEEAAAVAEVIASGWICQGPKVAEFERAVARIVGAKHGVATTSATSALHLTMLVMGVMPGDEVILPTFTCMANVNAVVLAGAIPVFADIEAATYNLDVEDVQARIGPKTKAIMLVDQIGLPAPLSPFVTLARQHGLLLFDDAATAFGARYEGVPLGGHGVPSCFSFHPRKMITTGEGGMLVTDNEAFAERARVLRATGASVSDLVRHEAKGAIFQAYYESGFNYRLTDMQAAMGLVQLNKLDEMLRARAEIAARYNTLLADVEEVQVPFVPAYASPAWSSYCIRVRPKGKSADELVVAMAKRNVSCRRGIQPLHHEPYFAEASPATRALRQGLRDRPLLVSEAAARETMFLPIFPGLRPDEVEQVVSALKSCLVG